MAYKDNEVLLMIENCQEELSKNSYSIESLLNNFTVYESFIPEFFSKTGEADNIRTMYDSLKNKKNEDNKIVCISLNESASIYDEYLEGMISFMNDIQNIEVTEGENSLEQYTEKFNRAKENDSIFIESLFNGKLTKEREIPLSEAVSNIEYCIDFNESLKTIKNTCINIQESFTKEDNIKTELLGKCRDMLFESVSNYCYSTLKNVINIYENINDVLNEKEKPININEGFKLL